jgi:hypothetical protein
LCNTFAAAAWKFNVVHLAHIQDDVYPIAAVQNETGAMEAAGFPITLIQMAGEHYDANTEEDLKTILLPYLDAGWVSP